MPVLPNGSGFEQFVQWGFYIFGSVLGLLFYTELRSMRKNIYDLSKTMVLVVERQCVQARSIDEHDERIGELEKKI